MPRLGRRRLDDLHRGHAQTARSGISRHCIAAGSLHGAPPGGEVDVVHQVDNGLFQPGRFRLLIRHGAGEAVALRKAQFVVAADDVAGVVELIGQRLARVAVRLIDRRNPGGHVLILEQLFHTFQRSAQHFHGSDAAHIMPMISSTVKFMMRMLLHPAGIAPNLRVMNRQLSSKRPAEKCAP